MPGDPALAVVALAVVALAVFALASLGSLLKDR